MCWLNEKLWGNRTAELDYRGGRWFCRLRRLWRTCQLRRFPWCLWLLWSLSGFGAEVGVLKLVCVGVGDVLSWSSGLWGRPWLVLNRESTAWSPRRGCQMGWQWLITGRWQGSSGSAELEFWLSEGAIGWKSQVAEQHVCYPSSAVVLAWCRHSARCPDRRCG